MAERAVVDEYRQLDAIVVHNEATANKRDIKKVIYAVAAVAFLDILCIPIFGLFIAVQTITLSDYASCDEDSWGDCTCDILQSDYYCDPSDDGWITALQVFSVMFLCVYEGSILALQTFVLLYCALWGEHTLLESVVIAFGKWRQNDFFSDFRPMHFGARLLELIWIIVMVATYTEMKNCSCDGDYDDPDDVQIHDSFYSRRELFVFMVTLLVIVSLFIISRRCIRSLIRNVRVTQKTQLVWLTIYDRQRLVEYDTFQ